MVVTTSSEADPKQAQVGSEIWKWLSLLHPRSTEGQPPAENTFFWQPTQLFGIKLVLNGAVLAGEKVVKHELVKKWIKGGEYYVHLRNPAHSDTQTDVAPSTFEGAEDLITFFESNQDTHVLCMPAGMENKQRLLLHRIRMLLQDENKPQLMFPILPRLHGKSVLRLPAISKINEMREYFFPSERFFIAEISLLTRLISETNRQVFKVIAEKHSLVGAELDGLELLLLVLIDGKIRNTPDAPKITAPISMVGFSDFWYTHVYTKGQQKHKQSPQTDPATRKRIIDIFCDELRISADEYAEMFSKTEAISAYDF